MMSDPQGRLSSLHRYFSQFILPFAVRLVFRAAGETLRSFLGTWIPGSVIGMLLLLLLLSTGLVKAAILDRISDWLLDRLGLFFICPGVEVIRYLDLVGAHWLSLVVAIVGSSVVTLVATGWIGEIGTSRRGRREHKEEMDMV
jgi:holin-like protein